MFALEAGEITADIFREWRIWAQENSPTPVYARDWVGSLHTLLGCVREGIEIWFPSADHRGDF